MKKILSIDDEPDILKCFKDALQTQGYAVTTTTDPDEGLDILRRNDDFDLVLLDVKMPGKTGFEVYEEMRAFRELPVLFVTAYPKSFTTDSDEVVKMWQDHFADGATDIIYKPFELDAFFNKIAALIGESDDERETDS